MIILITGPQGSGKTTQAKLLAEHFHLDFISMGQVLRDLYDQKDPLGIEAEQYWGRGNLVPDGMMREVVERFFETRRPQKGFVMDGFPRNILQYQWMLDVFKQPVDYLIDLTLDEKTVIERLNKRRQIEHREDDTPAAVKHRLQTYHRETQPLLQQFAQDGIAIITVDASPEIEKIQTEIVEKLETKNSESRIQNE